LPGLLNDASLFEQQADALADVAGITIADLTGADTIGQLAADTLASAPDGQFVLVGLSMGGYVALEIMRQAPERVRALVLVSTSAHPETREATAARKKLVDLAETKFQTVIETLLTRMAHPDHARPRSAACSSHPQTDWEKRFSCARNAPSSAAATAAPASPASSARPW